MIRRLILDVLKPHKPNVVEVSEALSHLQGVEGVNVIIYEIDQQVENAKIIIAGNPLDFEEIKNSLDELNLPKEIDRLWRHYFAEQKVTASLNSASKRIS